MTAYTASYLPSAWRDDDKMASLMSMFKNRDVNPHDYDTKLAFWTDVIERSCRDLSDPVISLSKLKKRFVRGDRIPAGLSTVMEHMLKRKEIVAAEECLRSNEGWLSWGVGSLAKQVWWLLGSGEADVSKQDFVHMETLKEMATKVVNRHEEERDRLNEDGLASSVFEYGVLRARVRDICTDDQSFELVINQLLSQGAVSVGTTGHGEKIVKFRDTREQGPVRLTETDTNIHGVRQAMTKLEKDITKLEENAKKYEDEARVQLRNKNKTKAKQLLRQKLLVLKKIKEKDGQYDKLLHIMHRLAQTREQKDILDAYKAGVSAFKQNLDRHGLSSDKIDETMEDINEALGDHEDISMALSQGPSGIMGDSADEELEEELNELLKEDERKRAAVTRPQIEKLPAVPADVELSEPLPKVPRDRLQELRRQLEQAH